MTDDKYESLKWYEKYPVINVIYDLLFDEPPCFSALDKTLNLFGLVDALLLTVVMTIPMSFSYDELVEMNERYTEPGGYRDFFNGLSNYVGYSEGFEGMHGMYSNRLNFNCSIALNCLSMSFISVVILYVVMSNSNLQDDETTKHWWKYIRWLVLGQFVFTMVGFTYAYNAIYLTVECKFPDSFKEEGRALDSSFEPANTHTYNKLSYMFSTIFAVVTTMFVASFGSTNRYWFKRNPHAGSSIIGMGIFLPWERDKGAPRAGHASAAPSQVQPVLELAELVSVPN